MAPSRVQSALVAGTLSAPHDAAAQEVVGRFAILAGASWDGREERYLVGRVPAHIDVAHPRPHDGRPVRRTHPASGVGEERSGPEYLRHLGRAVGQRIAQILGRIIAVRLDLLAALLIAFGVTLLDRLVAGHLLDNAGHIVVAPGDLDHAVGEAAVVHLDGIQVIGGCLHFRNDVSHFLIERFEEILKGHGRGRLKNALELLDKIVGIEEGHAAKEHVDAAATRFYLGQRQAHQIVVMDVDAA